MEESAETTSKQESEIDTADNSSNNATLSSKSSDNEAEAIPNYTTSDKENSEQSPNSAKSENTDEVKEILNLKRRIDDRIICDSKKFRRDECLLTKSETAQDVEMTDDKISVSDDEEYYLTISNLPENWSGFDIKNYLDIQCGPVDEIEMLEDGKIRLTFQNLDQCKQTLSKLHGKEVQGMKIIAEISELCTEVNKSSIESAVRNDNTSDSQESDRSWRPDIDIWEPDPQGIYGLRPEFLKSLNITPPLDRWVHVSNFRCEKADLRDVMELAGQVIMCSVVSNPKKYAKVLYSHPLEAVQAIAMLNDQLLYGQPLKVCMFRNPGVFILPKGLASIGIGLGSYGKPIRNVVQEFRRLVSRQSHVINPLFFSKLNESEEINEIFERTNNWDDEIKNNIDILLASTKTREVRSFLIKNVEDLGGNNGNNSYQNDKKTVVSNQNIETTQTKPASPGPYVNRNPNQNVINMADRLKPPFGPPLPNNVPTRMNNAPQRFPRPLPPMQMRPGPGPMNGPRPFIPGPRPFSGPFGPQIMPGPFVPRPPMQPGMNFTGPIGSPHPRPGHMPQGNKVTVEFKNLPPTTTFPVLCEKLSHCGQVMAVQLTTPGCAIATFSHPTHADRCYQTYNRMNVEGYILEVQYV